MAWSTATDELRKQIADGPTNKLRYRKKVLGVVDGTNKKFKTFEKRRYTDFSTNTNTTLGTFVDNVSKTVTSDNTEIGEFELTTAPAANTRVEASYFHRWFNDDELQTFLLNGAEWLGFASIDTVPPGLQQSCKHYAAFEAYKMLVLMHSEGASETYRLEDAPADVIKDIIDRYDKLATQCEKKATELRNNFYEGKGQENSAYSVSIKGSVSDNVPKR